MRSRSHALACTAALLVVTGAHPAACAAAFLPVPGAHPIAAPVAEDAPRLAAPAPGATLADRGAPALTGVTGREPVVGGPCEGCEAVFQGIPARLSAVARIAPAGEGGEPMRIEGTVMHADGTPVAGVVVYAYHTDAGGVYPPDPRFRGQAAYRHGRLRAWVLTDARGRYRFDTIRPGGYPGSSVPQHVHMHVIEPGRCTYYIDSIVFDDDPRLTPRHPDRLAGGRGGPGLVRPGREPSRRWRVERDIVLGAGVPGHPAGTGVRSRKGNGSR